MDELIIEDLKDYNDITIYDNGHEDVQVHYKGKYINRAKVCLDSEEDNREYICINNEIIYLDTLNKI